MVVLDVKSLQNHAKAKKNPPPAVEAQAGGPNRGLIRSTKLKFIMTHRMKFW